MNRFGIHKELIIGQVLVPRDTPEGPLRARVAWSDSLRTTLTVYKSEKDGKVGVLTQGGSTPIQVVVKGLLEFYVALEPLAVERHRRGQLRSVMAV